MNIKDLKPNANGPYKQGYFLAKNPQKYYGDPSQIIYRSSYEKRFMEWVDLHPRVTQWGSEPVAVPYMHPIKKKLNNYYVDFFVKVNFTQPDGQAVPVKYLVEVKPETQTKPPVRPKALNEGRMTLAAMKRYNRELETYLVNTSKFAAAKSFAEASGMRFIVCTEKFLF